MGLIVVWLVVVLGLPSHLPIQVASWLTFLALLIAPGYCLGDMITWRLDLDWIEKLALALPLSVVVIALPGMISMLAHLTVYQLTAGWQFVSWLLLLVWAFHVWRVQRQIPRSGSPWTWDQVIMLLLLIAAFVYIFPTLCLYKIDGDAYTFIAFARDALSGAPMNVNEPLFGTELGPGVRMVFNQMFPVSVLWSHLSAIDRVDLSATANRSMIALWAMIAAYTLGKAAGKGDRRFGLFTALVQMLIYMSALFLHSDSVSSFFFERINTDKFTVPVTMLPVVFAFTFRYLEKGRIEVWLAAALVTFAVSTIHPLIAAMLALALSAFGALHLLLNLRRRVAWVRVIGMALLVGIVMFLPFVQLVMAQGEAPLAPTYPQSLEGWSVGEEMVPMLPFFSVQSFDLYGPLPELGDLEAAQANTAASPFLVWRFHTNMQQRRIILFDLDRYVCEPRLILEPPYILALLLLPLLLWRIRASVAVQFVVSTTLALIFVMFNPIVTPMVGRFVIPWLMWRFIWLLPYALTIALAINLLLQKSVTLVARLFNLGRAERTLRAIMPLCFILAAGLLLRTSIADNIQTLNYKASAARFFPAPAQLLARLEEETVRSGPVIVAADQELSVTLAAHVANANLIGHRILNTSEIYPADQQDVALQRLIDQYYLFQTPWLTEHSIEILREYDASYIVASAGSDLDLQLHLSPQWFEWLLDDQSYSLFAIRELPTVTASIRGNTAMEQGQWATAQERYQNALHQDPADLVALVGLAETYYIQGQFDAALDALQGALSRVDLPILHYRLGRLYAEMGQIELSIAELNRAQEAAPDVARFHVALGDACLNAGQEDCAQEQYEAAVDAQELPDEASRFSALAGLWQQRGDGDRALAFYKEAAILRPNETNQLSLAGAYIAQKQFDQAAALLRTMREEAPHSARLTISMAGLMGVQDDVEQAEALYRHAMWLQNLQMQDTTFTHLELAQALLEAGRLAEAHDEIEKALARQPYNASAYTLLGNLYSEQYQPELAIAAYQKALQLDPSQVVTYISLGDQYQQGTTPAGETLDLFQTATELNPQQATLFLFLGEQLQRLGDVQTAIAVYQLALDLLGTDNTFSRTSQQTSSRTRVLAYSRLAAIHEDLGQIEIAMNYYNAAVTASPAEPRSRVLLGDALRRRNDPTAAEAAYRHVMQIDATYVDAYLRLADLLIAQGDTETASQLYDQAVQAALSQSDQRQQAKAWLGLGNFYRESREADLSIGSEENPIDVEPDALDSATQNALDAYVRAMKADAGLASVHALARLYQEIGRADQAIQLYQEKIQQEELKNPSPTLLSRYYGGIGQVHLAQGQADQAIQAYQRALDLDGQSSLARMGLARALSEQGDKEGALRLYEEAVQVAPGSLKTQLALADALDQQGDKDRALAIYQAAAQAHPGNVLANLTLARALQERHHWDEAEQSYRQAITMTPGDPLAYAGLAGLYTIQARYDEAETLLQQANRVDRSYARAYIQLGELMARLARHSEALATYEQAKELAPSDWRIYAGLGGIYHSLGKIDRAVTYFQSAAALDQTVPDPLLRLATLYQEQGQPDRAEEMLLQALERAPTNASIRYALAQHYRSLDLDDKALAQLRQAMEENPGSMETLVSYANELRRQGRKDQAADFYRQAGEASEASSAGYRTLALAHQTQKHSEEALTLIEEAIAYAPDEPANWIVKGQIQAQLGELAAAQTSLQQATQLGPSQGQTWQALGSILLDAGHMEDAIAAYEQAIAVEPTYLPAYGSLIQLDQALGHEDQAVEMVAMARAAAPGSHQIDLYNASLLESQLQWDKAREALEQAIAKAPGLTTPRTRLGELLARRVHYSEAIVAYEQAIQAAPGEWPAYAGLGGIYHSLGQIDRAINNLQRAVSLDHTTSAPLLKLADLYHEQNQPDRAEEMLLLALERSPGNASIRYALAQLYQAQNSGDKALEQLRLVVEENPNSMEALVSYASELRLLGHEQEAESLYLQAEKANEPSPAGLRALALARQAQGQREEALALVEEAIGYAPDEPATWILKGQFQAQMGDEGTAIASLQQATQLGPGRGEVWHTLGNVLLSTGKTEEAIAALGQATTVEPTYLPAYSSLIRAYHDLGQEDRVASVVAAAQAAVPGNYAGDLYQARFLEAQQSWAKARAAVERAMTKAPGVPDPLLAMGELERLQGNADQALTWYEQAISLRPGDRGAILALIDLLLEQGYYDEALRHAQRAVANRPGDSELLLRLGKVQRARGRYPEAEAALLKAADLNRADGTPYAALADLYLAQGKLPAAIDAYQQAITRRPDEESNYLALSRAWSAWGHPDQALTVLQEALSQVSRPAPLYVAVSSLYLQQGELDLALETLEQGLQATEQDIQLLDALGAYYQSQAQFDRAAQIYAFVVAQHPEQTASQLTLAGFYLSRGRTADALAQYKRTVVLEPSDPAAHLALGDAYRLLGHPIEATIAYSQALALAPTQVNVYLKLASLYQEQARGDKAQALYEQALAIAPTSGQVMLQYSTFLLHQGDEKQALALLDRASSLSARAETFVTRANLYRVLGHTDDARRDLQTATEIEPGSVTALIALGDLYRAQGNAVLAKETYQQAVLLAPGGAMVHLSLANLAYEQGRLDEALHHLQSARQAEPASGDVALQLAKTHLGQGDWREAEAAYRQAIDLAPLTMSAYDGLATLTYRQYGDLEQALNWLYQAQQLNASQGTVYRAIGKLYRADGQSSRTADYFLQAAHLEPASAGGYLALAELYLAQGLPEKAKRYTELALQISSRNPQAYISLGDVYHTLSDIATAQRHYQTAIALDATRPDGYLALASLHMAQEQYPEAIVAYQQAIQRSPLDWSLYVSLSDVYAQQDQIAEALSALDQAIAMNASVPEPWLRKGAIYLEQEEVENAQAAFERAMALRPAEVDPLLRLSTFYQQQADLDEAEYYARQAITMAPFDASAHKRLGDVLTIREQNDEAAASYLTAIQLDPRQFDIYERWIRLYIDIETGPFRVDMSRLETALAEIANGPDSKVLWAQVLLGRGYRFLEGSMPRAIVYLEAANAQDPVFAELYQQLALAYEEKSDGRPAVAAWYRYMYATARRSDTSTVQERINWLQKAWIDEPTDGAVISGSVAIVGTATRDDFEFYKLEYRAAGSDEWIAIGEPVYQTVEHGQLGVWTTTGLVPGDYWLRLTVVENTGNFGPYDEIKVRLKEQD